MPPVGPVLPPHLAKRKRSEEHSPPPPTSPPSRSSSSSSTTSKRRRIIGPAPPPAPLSERPSTAPSPTYSTSSSSASDDFGPSLPPAPGSHAAQQSEREQIERTARVAAEEANKKPQREEWMLVPPSNSDWSSRVDPTKLKNRKFQSGKGARAPGAGDSAVWTETPEEKRQRLEDEIMGRQGASQPSTGNGNGNGNGNGGGGGGRAGRGDAEERETERKIKEYNEKRGGSLLKAHKQAGRGKEEEDDPSKREFDREKDMGLGTKIGEAKKREMVKRAGDFTSRFEKGKYL